MGYWEQTVHYRIVARLDEARGVAIASGELLYANNSPDTLREMYFHQYLNAFRPASKWSASDQREGRERYQSMREPDFAYERFTSPPLFGGTPVEPHYPGAPDSTVARFALPRPLAPGDSVRVTFEWEARPSTLPRRQARRGRHFDFAQWYPKVAVYDRGGWQQNALVPAGEFYGEFGTYDVGLLVAKDQVLGATGVPVGGDPGYERVRKWGEVTLMRDAYGRRSEGEGGTRNAECGIIGARDRSRGNADTEPGTPLAGDRCVRFLAENVHHFAWSASPDYMYEGGMYDDRVAVHVLYRPGDEAQWGKGQAVERTRRALQWLESVYGRYAYPQVTNLHRLDGGGTEFPMMMMNGSASQGLILHEGGHIYTYGILANNEWRSGWMDEGLTSYQTSWSQNLTLHDRAQGKSPRPAAPPKGYRRRAARPLPHEGGQIFLYRLDRLGRAQPIGTTAHEFNEFTIYNAMIYSRAEQMYGALRDVMGDSAFAAFLRLYYDRWKLKHVDELAMRWAAESVHGEDLGWFFDQWVHRTGLIDYRLDRVEIRREGDAWLTRGRVVRSGAYRHPMSIGARTSTGWVIARAEPKHDDQWVEIRTSEKPQQVRLDPLRVTEDWYRPNDVAGTTSFRAPLGERLVFDWPFLEQADRNRVVTAVAPLAWYSSAGGVNVALRARNSYHGWMKLSEAGLAVATRKRFRRAFSGDVPSSYESEWSDRIQGWVTAGDLSLRGSRHAVYGGGIWRLDGITKVELGRLVDDSPFLFARGPQVTRTVRLTATVPHSSFWADQRRWSPLNVVDLSGEVVRQPRDASGSSVRSFVAGGVSWNRRSKFFDGLFGRAELEVKKQVAQRGGGQTAALLRGFAGLSEDVPLQRAIRLSSPDPTQTFGNHFLRPRDGVLSHPDAHYIELGGAGLRGYSPFLTVPNVLAVNAEIRHAAFVPRAPSRAPQLWISAFGDAGYSFNHFRGGNFLADAGLGLSLRGRIYDRAMSLNVNFPLFVEEPQLAVGENDLAAERLELRWSFSFNEMW